MRMKNQRWDTGFQAKDAGVRQHASFPVHKLSRGFNYPFLYEKTTLSFIFLLERLKMEPCPDPLVAIFQDCKYSIVIPRADFDFKSEPDWFRRQDLKRTSMYYGKIASIFKHTHHVNT